MIITRNWRDVPPSIAHKSGIDWRLLSTSVKTAGDIDAEVEPKFRCLKAITYVSLAKLQPSLSYGSHTHKDHEELYYIINGKGRIEVVMKKHNLEMVISFTSQIKRLIQL